jgi:DNA-binding NtrC family response regulator
MAHDWPGNVRQLRNAVIAAHALADDGAPIDVASHVGGSEIALGGEAAAPDAPGYHAAKRAALDRFERAYFGRLLAECDGNVSEIARRSGIERAHVRRHLSEHGLLPARARRKHG